MYCPRCGEKQLTAEVRFCSRCGFHLVAVSQLLETEGIDYMQIKNKLPLIKRPELRKRAKHSFLSLCFLAVSFPLAGIIDPLLPVAVPVIIIVPFIIFLVTLGQMIYYVLFGESLLPIKNQSFAFGGDQPQLNYQSAQSLPSETQTFDTAEFIPPPSITEPTAKLTRNK